MKKQHKYRGYTITRGSYQSTSDDRLDRWYVDDPAHSVADRRGAGFATLRDAKQHIKAASMTTYPIAIAREVTALRPDLAGNDAVSVVLTSDPTLSAQDVIDILDQATADARTES